MIRSCRRLVWTIAMAVVALSAGAEPSHPRHGLMWQTTGLPAVFPLQIKTPAGADYYVILRDAQTGVPALAAYIEGGRFFKVLVPPGIYGLRLASGQDWQSEEALFGPDTTIVNLQEPLTFEVRGVGVKAGHRLDVSDPDGAVVLNDSFICQRFVQTRPPRPQAPFDDRDGYATRLPDSGEILRRPNKLALDRLSAGSGTPVVPGDFAPYWSQPAYDLRDRPC